jgi:hypothetical protein
MRWGARPIRRDLHRFKQILETGEVATTEGQPSGRRSARAERERSGRESEVEEASWASFPASDAPAYNP